MQHRYTCCCKWATYMVMYDGDDDDDDNNDGESNGNDDDDDNDDDIVKMIKWIMVAMTMMIFIVL